MQRPPGCELLGRAGAAAWARLRSSLWPLPVLAIVLAIGLGVGLPAWTRSSSNPVGSTR